MSGFQVSRMRFHTQENIVAVTIYDKREVDFVSVITNTILNTVDVDHVCWETDFNKNHLAIRAIPKYTYSHIVYSDFKDKWIDRSIFSVCTPHAYHYVMIPLSVRIGKTIRFTVIHYQDKRFGPSKTKTSYENQWELP